jgi:hypothetical protein
MSLDIRANTGIIPAGSELFSGCTGLTEVTIRESIKTIGAGMFSGCTALTSVIIKEGITSIGNYSFNNCTKLDYILIPESVTSIGYYSFEGCTNLKTVHVEWNTPSGVIVSNLAFSGLETKSIKLDVPPGTEDKYRVAPVWKDFNIKGINITLQPQDITVINSSLIVRFLSIQATLEGGVPEYQWYSNTTKSNAGGTEVTGETSTMFIIPRTLQGGKHYFFCEVRAKGFNPVRSEVATVTIEPSGDGSVGGITMSPPCCWQAELWGSVNSFGVHSLNVVHTRSSIPDDYVFLMSVPLNSDGTYSFDGLPAGDYIVLIVDDDGVTSVPSPPITLADGETVSNINFTVKDGEIVPGNPEITGTEDVWNIDLKIYPNPFTGAVRITGAEGGTLRVFAESGATVHVQKITSPDETIRLEHLPAGVYLFCLEKAGKVKTVKVIRE